MQNERGKTLRKHREKIEWVSYDLTHHSVNQKFEASLEKELQPGLRRRRGVSGAVHTVAKCRHHDNQRTFMHMMQQSKNLKNDQRSFAEPALPTILVEGYKKSLAMNCGDKTWKSFFEPKIYENMKRAFFWNFNACAKRKRRFLWAKIQFCQIPILDHLIPDVRIHWKIVFVFIETFRILLFSFT